MTLCLQLKGNWEQNGIQLVYGENFFINVTLEYEEVDQTNQIRLENTRVQPLYPSWKPEVERLSGRTSGYYQCFKITTTWAGSEEVRFSKVRGQLGMTYSDVSLSGYGYVFVTSEANSYGLLGGQWFDGHVEEIYLDLYRTNHLHISKMTEYRNIESTCSKESYYECLAKRLTKMISDMNLTTNKTMDQPDCEKEDLCYPFTLPIVGNDQIVDVCQNDKHKECFGKTIKKLRSDQEKHCRRSCIIKEYHDSKTESFDARINYLKELELKFEMTLPTSVQNLRSEKPFKIVETEYWIVTELSLIGTVGGTLGMFIGFSVIGTSEWLMQAIDRLKSIKSE